MTLRNPLIAAGVMASLFADGSLAAAETTAPTTPQTSQQASTPRSQMSDFVGRMIEHCNRTVRRWSE
jgi:hypothetical protein